MATLAGEVLAQPPSGSENQPSASATSQPTEGKRQFKRNIFVTKEETGRVVGQRGRLREGETEEYVEFGDSLKNQYRRFLEDYTKNLTELRSTRPDVFDTILSNPNHAYDRELVRYLCNTTVDEKGRVVDMRPSDEKIRQFLDKPEGYIVTTQLLEQQIALKLFALGLHAANLPPGERQTMADPMVIRLGIDQGILNRIYRERIKPHLGTITGIAAGAIATLETTGLGFFANNIGGGLIGAAVPPTIYGMYRAIQSLRRDGLRIDLRQCSDAFQVINSDPAEREYVRRIMGINVDDFQDMGGNRIIARTNITSETTRHVVKDLENEVLQGLYTRQEFYANLGIPPERLDALPEQFLFAYPTGAQEQTGTRWQQRVQEHFNPNNGGILDTLGRPRSDPNFMRGPGTTLDVTGNLQRFIEARRGVLMEDIGRLLRKEVAQGGTDKPINALNTKIEQRREGGSLRQERTNEINNRKTVLENDRSLLQTDRSTLNTYREALNTLQEAYNQAQQNFGVSDIAGINGEITRRQQGLVDEAIPGSYAAQLATLETDQENAINTALAGIPATLLGKARELEEQRRVKGINDRFEGRRQNLKERVKDQVDEQIAQLKVLRTTIETNQKQLTDTEQVTRQAVEQLIRQTQDLTDITGWGITENNLRTLTLDQIIEQINTAYTVAGGPAAIPPVGWAENQNSRGDFRLRVFRAMVEARARQIESADPANLARQPDFTAITGWHIAENQLRTLTGDQLMPLINAEYARSGGVNGWDNTGNADATNIARVENARAYAQNRLTVRFDVLNERINNVNELIRQQDAALAGIDFNREMQQMQAAKDLLERYGTILGRVSDVIDHRLDYTSTTVVTAADTDFTQAERALAAPKGYYEIINLLFDYKIRPDRNTYFPIIQRVLSPDRLAQAMNESLGLGLAPVTINNVLNELQTRTDRADGRITSHELNEAFMAIVNRAKDEALAI